MGKFHEIYDIVTGDSGAVGAAFLLLAVALFIAQLCFWLGRYARIPKYRNARRNTHNARGTRRGAADALDALDTQSAHLNAVDAFDASATPDTHDFQPAPSAVPDAQPGISVVVILGDDFEYLTRCLPAVMDQKYPEFELMVLELSTSPEFTDELEALKLKYSNLSSARLDPDPRFRVSNKMAYNIAIKSARYDNIILTASDSRPVSSRWLECMAKGFAHGDVILGYCGLERSRKFSVTMMRCSRLMLSIRYLSSAISGKPYRGILPNLGLTKRIYFDNRGFDHLDMNIGEDDLFVQKIARAGNTSIVMNPHATVRQAPRGGLGWWWRRGKMLGASTKYYTPRAKRAVMTEPLLRLSFLLCTIAAAAVLPLYSAIGVAVLWAVRLFVMRHTVVRIARRLGDRGLGWAIIPYDIAEPFSAIALAISRRIKPAPQAWK